MCPLINKSVVVNCQLELKPKVERLGLCMWTAYYFEMYRYGAQTDNEE